jgi:hypothetical protein
VWTAADDEEDVDEDLDEFPDAEGPAEPAGDEGEEKSDDDDLYADLAEPTRSPDVAKGREGDGGEEGGGIISAELDRYLRTINESQRRLGEGEEEGDGDDEGGVDGEEDGGDGAGGTFSLPAEMEDFLKSLVACEANVAVPRRHWGPLLRLLPDDDVDDVCDEDTGEASADEAADELARGERVVDTRDEGSLSPELGEYLRAFAAMRARPGGRRRRGGRWRGRRGGGKEKGRGDGNGTRG